MQKTRLAGLFWISAIVAILSAASARAAPDGKSFAPGAQIRGLEIFSEPESSNDWTAASELECVFDKSLGMLTLANACSKPLDITGTRNYQPGIELRAWVRLRGTQGSQSCYAAFNLAQPVSPEAPKSGFSLSLQRNNNLIKCAVAQTPGPFHDIKALSAGMDWTPIRPTDFNYYPQAYTAFLPGWPEDLRARIESDMSGMPAAEDRWLSVRVELAAGEVGFWVDDRLVAWKQDAALSPSGRINIRLNPGAALSGLKICSLNNTPGYEPIPLAGYANARGLLGKNGVNPDSLAATGAVRFVEGIPMLFSGINPEGLDHMDIGRSLLRQANMAGYIQAEHGEWARWAGSGKRDPARIQLRIPNKTYDALYVVAAADDDRDEIPLLTAMFYRPGAGFAECFETTVPAVTAKNGPEDAARLPVKLENGKDVSLWLVRIPLEGGKLSAFADLDIVELELTKKTELYRSYPDPISYSIHQAGRPSSVHVYALTLAEAPVTFSWTPTRFGHVWTAPETPCYSAALSNRTDKFQKGTLSVVATSYDRKWTNRVQKAVSVPPGKTTELQVQVPASKYGYHDLIATLEIAGRKWEEQRSFARLAPDTRSVKWTEGKGVMFGYWSYHGGHYTPKANRHVELMTLAGARQTMHVMASNGLSGAVAELAEKHWGRGQPSCWHVTPQAWVLETPSDAAKAEKFCGDITQKMRHEIKNVPAQFQPDIAYFYPEPHISSRLTAGNYPEYWGDPPFEYTDAEKDRIKMFFETSRLAALQVRKAFPDRKILIPWGDPLFIVPLLRAGFPVNLLDGSGIDVPNFERLPEMQLADNACHRLYELRSEYAKAGITNPLLVVTEGAFVPTEPGACSWREQMDIYNRWALLFMAYGIQRFYAGWFAFDCGNYYGSEHYGGCGIQRRIPYCDPKPAYAAFAAMTDKLNEADYDGWLPTGSLSTYALRFRHADRGGIYTLWTLRGQRKVTLTLNADAKMFLTDAMNNTTELTSSNRQATVMTDPSVVYVGFADAKTKIESVAVGEPEHPDAQPSPLARQVADLGDGTWRFSDRQEPIYEGNHWGFYPMLWVFGSFVTNDPAQGAVLASVLGKQARERKLMPWYNILKPKKPVLLPGAPSHLGLWVRGDSGWGRVIYILRDAKGERWLSIGAKDNYNCDDVHSWSRICFDGWRYVRFELPGHEGTDCFRKAGTTWWRSAAGRDAPLEKGDQITDLPLKLEEIIVEQRSHVLYVNDPQPVVSDTILLGKLFVEYEAETDALDEAVRISRLRLPRPPQNTKNLPNPIAQMAKEGVGSAPRIIKLREPEHQYDGTRMHVDFEPLPGTNTYYLWVSAHAEGSGAVNMTPQGIKPGALVMGLRPGIKLYYWLTFKDSKGQVSKPSSAHSEITEDNFKEK